MSEFFNILAPLYHPVTILLVILSVVASRSPKAEGRRSLVLLVGVGLAITVGAICLQRDWVLRQVAILVHPISVLLILIAAFAWFASTASRKKGLRLLLGLIVGVGMGELYGRWYLTKNPILQRQRAALSDEKVESQQKSMLYVPQPYLLYAPSPGYKNGENWHNGDGYRGTAVPMERTPNVARVLCLGGSTTYSWQTKDPQAAYPAVLEKLLNSQQPPGSDRVEVINGGLPYGTTAELVAHYHFKFQYYAPDVVVINTGGNDAYMQKPGWWYYQPDYSHLRQSFALPQPLSGLGRTLLKSAFLSVMVLPHYMPPTINSSIVRPNPSQPPPVPWHPAAKKQGLLKSLTDDQLAFTRNLRRLIQMVKADGGDVVLVPFRIAPEGDNQEDVEQCTRNERILKELGQADKLAVAPFPLECITPENWVDSCHLNAAGSREKAEHIAPYVRDVLSARAGRTSTETALVP